MEFQQSRERIRITRGVTIAFRIAITPATGVREMRFRARRLGIGVKPGNGTKRRVRRTIYQEPMTEQEKQLIEGLASRIHNAPAPEIDRDADAVIRQGIGSRPDALYILTQTVLVQEMALNQATTQIEELKKKAESAPAGGSPAFLGAQAPSQAAPAAPGQPSWWGRSAGAPQQQAPAPVYAAPAPQYSAPPPLPQQAPVAGSGMFSGFLKTAATTAAGVVAGEVAFSALSGLFGHHSGGGFMGGGGSGFLGGAAGVSPGSETVVNNYYGSAAPDQSSTPAAASLMGGGAGSSAAADDSAADTDTDTDDTTVADDADDSADSDNDDSSSDDSGSYDDGGGDSDI